MYKTGVKLLIFFSWGNKQLTKIKGKNLVTWYKFKFAVRIVSAIARMLSNGFLFSATGKKATKKEDSKILYFNFKKIKLNLFFRND